MLIREARDEDWPLVHPFFAAIVAVDGDAVLGSARMGPDRPGRGAHVATASYMVDPARSGRGVGRALGEHVVGWARASGYRGMHLDLTG